MNLIPRVLRKKSPDLPRLAEGRRVFLTRLLVAITGAGITGGLAVACSDQPSLVTVAEGPTGTTRAQFELMVQEIINTPGSFGKEHNSHLDSLLVRIRDLRKGTGHKGPLPINSICEVIQEYTNDLLRRGERIFIAGVPGSRRCMVSSMSDPIDLFLAEEPPAPSSPSWTPVDYVDSLFWQSESWDPTEFEGPSGFDYRQVFEDAFDAVDALDYDGFTDEGDATDQIENAVWSAATSSSELDGMLAEVAAYGAETTGYWEENGEEFYDEICEGPEQVSGEGGLHPAFLNTEVRRTRPGFRSWWASPPSGEIPEICEDNPYHAPIQRAGVFGSGLPASVMPSVFRRAGSAPIARGDWTWGYAAVKDVLAGVGVLDIFEAWEEFDAWNQGRLEHKAREIGRGNGPDSEQLRLDLKDELAAMPEGTALEKTAKRKALSRKAVFKAAKRFVWAYVVYDCGSASLDALLH